MTKTKALHESPATPVLAVPLAEAHPHRPLLSVRPTPLPIPRPSPSATVEAGGLRPIRMALGQALSMNGRASKAGYLQFWRRCLALVVMSQTSQTDRHKREEDARRLRAAR
jgi:hypothetical protein